MGTGTYDALRAMCILDIQKVLNHFYSKAMYRVGQDFLDMHTVVKISTSVFVVGGEG